jgi:hypothetical protein
MRFTGWSNCPSISGNRCTVSMTASRTVTATFQVDQAPTVTIVSPATGSSFFYDGYDNARGLWYTDLAVVGRATDPEDGTLTGGSLVWTTNQTGIQSPTIGTGTNPTVRIYSNDCFGTTHTIRLTATDSAGHSVSTTITVTIYTVC